VLRPIGLQLLGYYLESLKKPYQLVGRRRLVHPLDFIENMAAQQHQHPPAKDRQGQLEVRYVSTRHTPHPMHQAIDQVLYFLG
jgi:hypothetical protein